MTDCLCPLRVVETVSSSLDSELESSLELLLEEELLELVGEAAFLTTLALVPLVDALAPLALALDTRTRTNVRRLLCLTLGFVLVREDFFLHKELSIGRKFCYYLVYDLFFF